MARTDFNQLLEAGVHFGHLKRRWNPKMAPYIFMERNGIHIIDLHKTVIKLDEAAAAMKQMAKSGRRILFVATKKQAKDVVAERAASINMPFVTERWPGGMLTNFPTIRKAVKKMSIIDKMNEDGTFAHFSKRERLQITRQREKLEKNLGSIADLTRLPAALFIVDIQKESNAVKEARKLNIPIFAIVDTCCDPTEIDYVIPGNDDATKSIEVIMDVLTKAVAEGLSERKMEREKDVPEQEEGEKGERTQRAPKPRIKKVEKANIDRDKTIEAKPEAKTEAKAVTKVEVETEAKAVVKAETKAVTKVEVETEAKPEAEAKVEVEEPKKTPEKEEATEE